MPRVLFWYATGVLLLVVAYLAAPIARAGLVGAIGLWAVAAIEYSIRRLQPQRAGGWHMLAVAVALLAIGDITSLLFVIPSAAPWPYPGIPEVFYLAAYLPLTVALLWLGRPVTRYRDETSLLDAVAITLAGSLVVWILVVTPELEAQRLPARGYIDAIGAWVGFFGVLAVSVRITLAWRRNVSIAVLTVGVITFLVSEILSGQELVRGMWSYAGRAELGYVAFTVLCGGAALHPSMRDLAAPAQTRYTLGRWRLAVVGAVMLVGPTALLAETSAGVVRSGYAIGTISGLVSLLMLLRLSLTGSAYRRGAERERAARAASQAMVSAVTPMDVVDATRSALRKVVPAESQADVMLVHEYGGPLPRDSGHTVDLERKRPAVPNEAARSGELAIPLPRSDAALIFSAPADALTELAELLRLLAHQAALALQRIHFAEEAATRERERYFRSLVLTSSDVILISRDGRIEYATPSALDMFGRDVIGERFDDIVHPTRPTAESAAKEGRWPTVAGRIEATVIRRGRKVNVLVDRRDLTDDPSVRGVVTTIRDITAERELQNELEFRASHDELTGLANVRAWTETLSAEQDRRHGPGEGVAAMFIDLDDFKDINDRYGHAVGDEVLTEVARRIRAAIRAEDLAARVGGDEFAVLLRGLSSVDDARAVAQRLADSLARPTVVNSTSIDSKASVGLSYSEGTERIRTLVREADSALYAAKDQGKGRWSEYNPEQLARQRSTHDGKAPA